MVGETVTADAWFSLIRTNALFNKDAEKAIIELMPIVRLMGSSEALDWNTTKLSTWWEVIKERKGASSDATLLYSLFDALGEPVPEDAWNKLLVRGDRREVSMPNVAQWLRLIKVTKVAKKNAPNYKLKPLLAEKKNSNLNAIEPSNIDLSETVISSNISNTYKFQNRVGELVMLGLLALGEGGPSEADPLLLSQVLLGFRASGFEEEARTIAVEAALAAGL
jgi:hypothetical protein